MFSILEANLVILVSQVKLETNWELTGFFGSQIESDRHFNRLDRLLDQKPIESILMLIKLDLPSLLQWVSLVV